MTKIPTFLSKSKLLRGYQCLKNIYLTIHAPQLESPISPDTQAIFDQGNRVGEEARKQFPGGILIDNLPWDFVGSLSKTKELIANGTTILYEAAFEYKGFYARADIIEFSEETQKWKMFEVKSSTKLKDEHIDDIGLQAWIMAKSGLPLEQISLMHLNTDCIYPDLSNLFTTIDVTQKIRDVYLQIEPKVKNIVSTIQGSDIPDVDIGSHCTQPYDCGFIEHCWKEKNIPSPSVFDLPKINSKKWDLYSQGIMSLDDSRLTDMTPIQERIIQVHKSGKRFVNQEGIRTALSSWKFPLVFLDFETINPAIPRYDGCSPYTQVAFQYSVHILNSLDGEVVHKEFFHKTISDPRPRLIPKLMEDCGAEGVVVAYFSRFESDRILEMSELFPEYKEKLELIRARLVDPLPIIRDFVYDVGFNGSFSLKNVAPALLGSEASYDKMLVGDGGAAQRAYEEIIDETTSEQRKHELTQGILEYCNKDTQVMVDLVKWLFTQTKKGD